jgi:hypothetical protein
VRPRRKRVRARRELMYEAHRFVEGLARGFALLGVGDLARLAHLLKRLRWRPSAQAYTRGKRERRGKAGWRTSLKTFFWSSAIEAVKVKGADFFVGLHGGDTGNVGRPPKGSPPYSVRTWPLSWEESRRLLRV